MKRTIFLSLMTALLLTALGGRPLSAQTKPIVVATFDRESKVTEFGDPIGTWDKDQNDPTQGTRMSFAKDDALGQKNGRSVRLDYDVDSPNPAYNGFWVKIGAVKIADRDTLSFYIKGDSQIGFTPKIKIEIKDKKHGKATFFVDNITDKWQKISLTLDPRSLENAGPTPLEEFVVVFDDVNSRPKTGRILIDQVEFSKK